MGSKTDDMVACDCSERAPPLRYWRCPKCDAEWGVEPDDEVTDEEQAMREWGTACASRNRRAPKETSDG